MRTASTTAWLWVKVVAFTVVVPGTVIVLVPYLILGDPSLESLDELGISLLGLLPIVLGAALYLRCAYDFAVLGGGTPAPIEPPARLVKGGPYRYSRNPMYVGILSILAGEVLLYREVSLLSYLLAVAVSFQIFIVAYEERALQRQFGEAYRSYRDAVPRWIPSPSGWAALYRGTFLKVGAFVLAAGVVAHLLRLSIGLPVVEMPDSIHAFLVLLPAYAAIGCVIYARKIDLTALWQKIVFALATGLLTVTAVMHLYSILAGDNEWLGIFPIWYSVVAVIVYGSFAHFLKSRRIGSGEADRSAP